MREPWEVTECGQQSYKSVYGFSAGDSDFILDNAIQTAKMFNDHDAYVWLISFKK